MATPLFDNVSSLEGSDVSSLTFSHTCSGTNRYLSINIGFFSIPARTISSVTFNGVAATEVMPATKSGVAFSWVAMWELVNPAAVTADIVVTFSDTVSFCAAGGTSFTVVHQSTPRRGTYATATGNSTTASVDISSAVNDLVVDMVSWHAPSGITGGAGQTERWSLEEVGTGSTSYGSSTEAGAATTTMSWDAVNSTPWIIGAISLIPAANWLKQGYWWEPPYPVGV